MIVNFKNVNLLDVISFIRNNDSHPILIRYWRMLYFLFRWNNYFLFPMKYKLTKKRYKTQYNLLFFFWKYFKKYLLKEKLYESHIYIENFIEKNIFRNDKNILWNESKKEKKIENYIFFDIYFDHDINFYEDYKLYHNFFILKYLNICC
jgi:hypothetical protein